MKKKDWIVIVGLCVILTIGYGIYRMTQGEKDIIEIYYKNQVVETIDIHKNKTYTLQGSYGSFSLEVKDGQYRATHVDCPNHDCEKVCWVKQGSAKQIVCVPNEIYVVQRGMEDQVQ